MFDSVCRKWTNICGLRSQRTLHLYPPAPNNCLQILQDTKLIVNQTVSSRLPAPAVPAWFPWLSIKSQSGQEQILWWRVTRDSPCTIAHFYFSLLNRSWFWNHCENHDKHVLALWRKDNEGENSWSNNVMLHGRWFLYFFFHLNSVILIVVWSLHCLFCMCVACKHTWIRM